MSDVPSFKTAYSRFDRSADLFFPKDAKGAKQSFKDECDINRIVKSFNPDTGLFSHMSLRSPRYGDVSGVDFRSMMDFIADANEAFEALPAVLRARFANSAESFVEFCSDPANAGPLKEMGLELLQDGQVSAIKEPVVEGPPSVGTLLAVPVVAPAAVPGPAPQSAVSPAKPV